MHIKSLSILASAVLATAAFAQSSLGTVRNVQGLVTDTAGSTTSSTTPGEKILDGERFVTTSSGSVTLDFTNGCSVTLKPNQALTINSKLSCEELNASVSSVGPAVASGITGQTILTGAALMTGAFAIDRALVKNPRLSGS